MLKRFIPDQEGFFKLFQETSDCLVDSATNFHQMFNDLSSEQKYVDLIAHYEEQADLLTHSTFHLLHKTFITPFDRHDIHNLASGLDDILDLINRCAQRFPFYHFKSLPNELLQLADLNLQACKFLKQAVYLLNSLKKTDNILLYCNNIDKIESEAHKVIITGESNLFLDEDDFKSFIKLKETYTKTKAVINRCQDVANMIKGIVLEYS